MTTIFTAKPAPPTPPADLPTPTERLIGRYARLSVIIALMFSLATLAASVATLFKQLDGGFLLALEAATGVCLWGLAGSWFLGGVGGGVLTFWLEIWIPYKREKEDRAARTPKTEVVYQTLDLPPVERFKLAGAIILSEWLFHAPDLTRDAAVDGKLCTQTEWNIWNTILKQYGVRTTGNQWVKEKEDEVMYLWHVTAFSLQEKVLTGHLSEGVTMRFDLEKKGTLVK